MNPRLLFLIVIVCFNVVSKGEKFNFALLTDTHISINSPSHSEDLQRAIDEINATPDIDFVILDGDITDFGDSASLALAREIINTLHVPWYITSGNHDTKVKGTDKIVFKDVFGDDKFLFKHKGLRFIGFNTGPENDKNEGHIYPEDLKWLKKKLKSGKKHTPDFVFTHYPLLKGDVDNYKDITKLLNKYKVKVVINGHYHRNVLLNFDNIPGIVCRSTLRGNEENGGYTVFEVSDTSLQVFEKIIGKPLREWVMLPL